MNDCLKWTKPAITVLALVAMSQLASAQSGDAMAKPMSKETTYTGCLEAGSSGGFTLTHVAAETGTHKDAMGKDAMKKDTMGKDSMAKDSMSKDSMAKDSMGNDSMGKGTMGKDAMGKDAMAPTTLTIVGRGVDLSQHVGHKVSVTGRDDAMGKNVSTFAVSSITMVASSCGI